MAPTRCNIIWQLCATRRKQPAQMMAPPTVNVENEAGGAAWRYGLCIASDYHDGLLLTVRVISPMVMASSRRAQAFIAVLSRAVASLVVQSSKAVLIWSPCADAAISRRVTAADMGASRRAAPASAAIFNATSMPRQREKQSPIFLDTAL